MENVKKQKRKYRKYDASFKKDAVSQLESGRSAKELSGLLGVSESLLYKWKQDAKGGHRNRAQQDEVKSLRKQLKRLEEENVILKKALRIFSQSD